jgi:pimeloyl-ACP methyl ester carboxylesterase
MMRVQCAELIGRVAFGFALAAPLAGAPLLAWAQSSATSARSADAPHIRHVQRVGGLVLERCSEVPAYCGRLERPLDPTGAISGRISIYFEFYPHTRPGKSSGTLVATEGGPGYPATESRDDYLALWKPLRSSRDFVLMDNRGTGRSGAIDCHELQSAEKWTVELVGACGESLGDRSALYSTAYAADDLAAILEALEVGPIDLYGDSYGTYFEQVFALRHPAALRSVVLDGAYPLDGPDYAWYPTYAPAMRAKFDIACQRSQSCAKLPGSSIEHIQPVLEQLRLNPIPARAADSDGKEHAFIANAAALAIVMFGSAPALATVKELDAAARAFLDEDRAPLLRLMAETQSGVDSRDPTADPAKWSAGLAAAVMCHDPPQIFDMQLMPAVRAADRDRALAARRRSFPDTYAPFTIDEYRAMPLDYSFIDQCAAWPVAPERHPAGQVAPAGTPYPDVPALVISGELDNMTTVADGAAVARAFKHGHQVIIANSFHVNALPRARSTCAADIVRRFVEARALEDTSCAARVPPVRLVPRFATRADQLEPAIGLAGNAASPAQLQAVSAAVLTAGDMLTRLRSNSSGRGPGLRGGTFEIVAQRGSQTIILKEVRWTEDLAVSGTIDKAPGPTGSVRAQLDLAGLRSFEGHLDIRWEDDAPEARAAEIHGTIGTALVAAQTPAP